MKNRTLTTDTISKGRSLRKGTLISTALVSVPVAMMMFPTSAYAECVESIPGLFICATDDTDGITVGDSEVVAVLSGVDVSNAGSDIITVGEGGRITVDSADVGVAGVSANALVLGAGSSVEIVETGDSVVSATTNAITFNAASVDFVGTPVNSVINEGAITGHIVSNGEQDDTVTNRTGATITGNLTLGDGQNVTTNSGTITGNVTGGTGNDAVVNSAGATLTGNVILGDGNNGVINAGTLTGSVTTGSGDDAYSLALTGTHIGDANLGNGTNTATIIGVLSGDLATGSGDDTVIVASTGSVGDDINMGEGTNTATIAGLVSDRLDGGEGNDTVTITATGTVGGDVRLNGGDNTLTVAGTVGDDVFTGNGDDTITVSAGGLITGDVIVGDGINVVTVAGDIGGYIDGGEGSDNTDTVTITSTGTVSGDLYLYDGDNTVVVAGIVGDDVWMEEGDDTITVAAGGLVVDDVAMGSGTNTATVAGDIDGTLSAGAGDDTVTIASTGSVGDGVFLGDGTNSLNNSGDITGDITMGSGDDTIVTDGTITGNISMGAGTNVITFNAQSALPTGTLTADAAGDNTLNLGGTGADIFNISVANFDTLNKDGAGDWALDSFDNTYAGGININEGGLYAVGTSRFGANNIVNNAEAFIAEIAAGTYSGNMSGTGTFETLGTGTTTFSGTNTFTGGTAVTWGTLSVTGGSALADDGAVTVAANGTLAVTEAETIGSLTGVAGSALTLTETLTTGGLDTNTTFAGNTSGAGGLTKVGTGNMMLSGTNTHTGTTAVNGGALTLTGGEAIADTGAVTVGADGTLGVLASEIIGSLAGSGATVLATGAVLATGDATNTTYSGAITGAGSLTKVGAGNFTITGANSYTGGTTVTAGTLTGTTSSLQGDIADNGALVFDQGTDGTYAGVISGTGSLTKLGTGKVTISGANTYTGGTTVTAGTLAGTTTSIQGDVTNNATLMFDQDTNGTYADVVSGTGAVVKAGTGNLTVTGSNTHTGGTWMNGGTVTVGATAVLGDAAGILGFSGGALDVTAADASARNISLGAGGGTINSDAALDLSGVISGAGSLILTGTGVTTLTGTNTYTGGTTLAAGELTGSAASVQGNISNNGIVNFVSAINEVYAGGMSGTGAVTKAGAGNLTMTGTNFYSGGTTVTDGTLTGDSGSLQGDIANATAVVFAQAGNGTYAGDLSGAGTVTKSGAGTLTTTGDITHTGGTAVTGGRLAVNGTLVSDVTLAAGTELGGSGTITGNVTSTGATIAAGNSIGTLNIAGNLTLNAASSMEVELAADGTGDLVAATGTAALAGTVTFVAADGLYQTGTHDFVTATGGVSGTFGTVNGLTVNNFVSLTASYSATAATVTTTRRAYLDAASTHNQQAVAAGLDGDVATATGDFAAALIEIDYLANDAAAQAAFDQMSPESYGAFITAGQQAGDAFNNAINNRMHATDHGHNGLWIQGFGSWNSVDTDSERMGFDVNLYGVAGGFDATIGEHMVAGITAGYSSSDIDTAGLMRVGEMDSYQFGAYLGGTADQFHYLVSGFYGNNDGDMTRTISYGGVSRTAVGDLSGNEFRVSGRLSMEMGNAAGGFQPFIAVEYSTLSFDAFTETGADGLNLAVHEMNGNRFHGEFGMSYQGNLGGFHPTAHVAYRYAFDEDHPEITSSFTGGGTAFTVEAQERGRGSVVFGLGLVGEVSDSVTIFVNYNGDISSNLNSHAGSAGLLFNF